MQRLIILPARLRITACTEKFGSGRIDCSTRGDAETSLTIHDFTSCESLRKPVIFIQEHAIESGCF